MNTITRLVVYLVLSLTFATAQAQNKALDSINISKVYDKISDLEEDRASIERQEKFVLKSKISKINERLDAKDISAAEAENLKKEAAKIAALNIENRREIIDQKIELLKRNGYEAYQYSKDDGGDRLVIRIGSDENTSESIIYIGDKADDKPRKYDRRTSSDFVFAIGFNNVLIDGESMDDSPYKLGGSGFIEMGYAWKTRLFDNTNFWRLKYGFSVQWNKFDTKGDTFLVNNDGQIEAQEFEGNLDKAKFRTTNLLFPMHIEFGPSKKMEKKDYYRYSTYKQIKIGLGGYAGVNLSNMQKLKYKENGSRIKSKQYDGFEATEFIYGLSGYVALGDVALYVKYDLNPLFKNQTIDQNNISVGLRFDMD